MTQNFQGLTSLLSQIGQQAPGIFNSLNASQTASSPYLQNYNRMQQQPQVLGGFMPQQTDEIPTESIMPYSQENSFKMYSLLNSSGRQQNPFANIILS